MTKSHSAPCLLDPSVSNHSKLPFLNEQSCSLSLISVLSFRIQKIRTIHTISTVWMCLFSAVFITFISNEKKNDRFGEPKDGDDSTKWQRSVDGASNDKGEAEQADCSASQVCHKEFPRMAKLVSKKVWFGA